jgi:hypothetical protein
MRVLAQGRDAAYYEWIDAKGIDAPKIGIAYVGGGIADDNETYRGCVATAPIATGRVHSSSRIIQRLRFAFFPEEMRRGLTLCTIQNPRDTRNPQQETCWSGVPRS